MAGAPTKYSQELADKICERISTSSDGLRKICKELNVSTMTVLRWLDDEDKKNFCLHYARAKQDQADFLVSEILEIADDSSGDEIEIDLGDGVKVTKQDHEFAARSRLRVDARKWVASKLAPKKYGDKLDVTTDGDKVNTTNILSIEIVKPKE